MEVPQTQFLINIILILLSETARLKAENADIRKEKDDLETMLEMTTVHTDQIGADLLCKVDASIKEIEERIRLISETIPVPVIIAQLSDGKFLYVNEHACEIFGLSGDEFLRRRAAELYANPYDRENFVNILNEKGHVSNLQVCMKKADNSLLWAALFSQPLTFRNEPCVLTVVYDLTERRQAEEEIRRLTEELENAKERVEKYLMFTLAGQEYGIPIVKIKEIIGIIPITPVPNMPDFIRGVANLRGRVIPIADIRRRLGLEAAESSERTCIIISEIESTTGKRTAGIIVDAVSEVLGIRGGDIESPPEIDGKTDLRFISGMAKIGKSIKILLDIGIMWEEFFISEK